MRGQTTEGQNFGFDWRLILLNPCKIYRYPIMKCSILSVERGSQVHQQTSHTRVVWCYSVQFEPVEMGSYVKWSLIPEVKTVEKSKCHPKKWLHTRVGHLREVVTCKRFQL